MSEFEESVDTKVVNLADQILDYAKSIQPDIGFEDIDLTYSLCLAVAKQQEDADLSSTILDECYAVVGDL